MLNSNVTQGKWNELKGEIRKMWGRLTDDELDETRGDLTKIAGVIQSKYGETQEAIRNKLNSFTSSVGTDNREVSSRADSIQDERLY